MLTSTSVSAWRSASAWTDSTSRMFTTSVCTGSLLLGAAGVLDGLDKFVEEVGERVPDDPRIDETVARLREQKENTTRNRLVLVSNASMPRITAIEEFGSRLTGARVESRYRRRYHFGELFAHVIGYVGEVTVADLDTTGNDAGYQTGDMIGKQGVEAALEDVLKGVSGSKLQEVNASGRVVGQRVVWIRPVEPGRHVCRHRGAEQPAEHLVGERRLSLRGRG